MALSPFEFEASTSPAARWLAVSVLVLGIVGTWLTVRLATLDGEGLLYVGFALLGLGAGWRYAYRGLDRGALRVDAEGRAWWLEAAPEPAEPLHWTRGERLVWIRFRLPGGQTKEILLSRDAAQSGFAVAARDAARTNALDAGESRGPTADIECEERWRRLCSWLSWLGRGVAP